MAPKPKAPIKKNTPSAKTSSKTGGGTYIASSSGKLIRTTPIYKESVEIQSIDTTGYSKGKQNFELKTSKPYQKPSTKKISRKDVPSTIKNLKNGATRTVDWRTPKQKNNK